MSLNRLFFLRLPLRSCYMSKYENLVNGGKDFVENDSEVGVEDGCQGSVEVGDEDIFEVGGEYGRGGEVWSQLANK